MKTVIAPRRKTVSPIGLDIGQTGARAVQLRRADGGWALSAAQHWPLRGTEDRTGGIAGLEERFRAAMRQRDFVGRDIVVGLSQPDLETHALELPETQSGLEQLDSAARWEIERLSRFEEGGAETAHWWLPKGRGTRPAALGVAVSRQTVQEVWDLSRRIGADCRRIDALTCALARAGSVLRPPKADEVWGVLDLGARAVRLILCVDHVPVVARALEGGGTRWTEKIAESLKVSQESAELHKCDHGLRTGKSAPGDAGGGGETVGGPLMELASMIFAAVGADLDGIAREVERSYEYVLQCYPGRKAGDLILAGGSAALRNLDAYLADRLGIPVVRAEEYLQRSESLLCAERTADSSPRGLKSAARLREPLAAFLGAVGLAIEPEGGS